MEHIPLDPDGGKGDAPRRGEDKAAYDRGYLEAFGIECSVCKGKGSVLTITSKNNESTEGYFYVCKICNGLGKVDKNFRKNL